MMLMHIWKRWLAAGGMLFFAAFAMAAIAQPTAGPGVTVYESPT